MKTVTRKKQNRRAEPDTEGTWAISYGDMVTLLLSFFVLYFTVEPDQQQSQKLQRSLITSLSRELAGDKPVAAPAVNLNLGESEGQDVDTKVANDLGGEVVEVGHRLLVHFPRTSFFNSGQIGLTPQGQKALKGFAEAYVPFAGNYVISIRAFTDTRPVKQVSRRRFKDNLELSALRAIKAMRFLQSSGVPLRRMKIGGYGELNEARFILRAEQEDKSLKKKRALALARRVVLVVEPQDDEVMGI